MKILRIIALYSLLVAGSIIFIWPFLWMAATSAKVDRELFTERLRLLPERPIPRTHSPYVDEKLFNDIRGPRLTEALTMIEQHLAKLPYSWPNRSRSLDAPATNRSRHLQPATDNPSR